jgi:hypothetical protein
MPSSWRPKSRASTNWQKWRNVNDRQGDQGRKADGGAVDAALAATRRFTKNGIGATLALKSKGK